MRSAVKTKIEYYVSRALIKSGMGAPARKLLYRSARAGQLPDETQARRTLSDLYPKTETDCRMENDFSGEIDLSIIIPAYNTAGFIEKCVESALVQKTSYSYEIIITEDGSTDETAEKLKKYAKIENITLIFQENLGVAIARNRALAKARGKYIMFLDADDRLEPDAAERLLRMAYASDADIVQGSIRQYISEKRFRILARKDAPCADPRRDLIGLPAGKVFKNSLFKTVGFPPGYIFEDSIMSWILFPMCGSAATVEDVVYTYRKNRDSITNSSYLKPRVADAYWIYELMLEERAKRAMPLNEADYAMFLRNIVLAYSRMRFCDEAVRKSVFVLFMKLRKQYFEGFHTISEQFVPLERAMDTKNWNMYKICCLLTAI